MLTADNTLSSMIIKELQGWRLFSAFSTEEIKTLAPLLELADGIVDIVETGTTLKENGLEVIEDVAPISARLIANTVSLKMRHAEIDNLLNLIRENL